MSTIDITNYCNLECAYCYAVNDKSVVMPKEKVLSTILELKKANVWQIVLSGGEPFLHPEIMMILESILNYDIDVSLTTNGTVLSREQIKGLYSLQHSFPKMLSIQVSVDGPSIAINNILRGEGKRLFQNLQLMHLEGISFGIGTVLHRYNTDHVPELIEKFFPKVTTFHFLSLMPSHSVVKHSDDLYPTYDQLQRAYVSIERQCLEYPLSSISFPSPLSSNSEQMKTSIYCEGCSAAVTRMDINALGEVLACHIAEDSIMGNIYKNSVLDIWKSERASKYRHALRPLCRRLGDPRSDSSFTWV